MSERTIENVREYNLDPKEVIKGLNGYYESDKCNSYITVRRNGVEGPAYLSTTIYLSSLIEWLRIDYDIFYRPGLIFDQVEAVRNAAKMCCLKDIMDYIRQESSRNGFELPEEIDGEPLTIKRVFHDLLELLRKRDTEIRNAKQEARKAVNDQLTKDTDYIADALRDILEALGISKSNTVHLDVFGLKTKAIQRASAIKSEHDRYLEQLDKAAADYQALDKEYQELKNSQKSDTNKLIRDYCTTHGIIAPSRYFSDRASVEYVFSLLDSYSEQRNKAYDDRDRAVDDYKLNLKDYILKDIKKRGYRYDGLETKSIEEIVDWIITMATHAYKEVEDVQEKTRKECYDYLWNALKTLSPECDALKIDHYEDLVDRIFFEMCFVTENCKQCQRKHSTEKLGYIQRANKAEEEVKKLNDVIKKLKELLNEINKEEDE